jgi:hypothetical protein
MTDDLVTSADQSKRCAAACDRYIAEVRSAAHLIVQSGLGGGYGTLPSGLALAQKYSNLTHGPEGSLASMLAAHITVATNLREAFLAAGAGYEATEDGAASRITQSGPR